MLMELVACCNDLYNFNSKQRSRGLNKIEKHAQNNKCKRKLTNKARKTTKEDISTRDVRKTEIRFGF